MRLFSPFLTVGCALLLLLVACSDEPQPQEATPESSVSDRDAIQAVLNEIQVRWHYSDKSVLYENELPYLRETMTFDKYLEREEISPLEADSMVAMNIAGIEFFGRDSALVKTDVVFVGPLGDTTHLTHESTFYNYHETWLRPSISHPAQQKRHDEIRRVADSTAAAEENEEW